MIHTLHRKPAKNNNRNNNKSRQKHWINYNHLHTFPLRSVGPCFGVSERRNKLYKRIQAKWMHAKSSALDRYIFLHSWVRQNMMKMMYKIVRRTRVEIHFTRIIRAHSKRERCRWLTHFFHPLVFSSKSILIFSSVWRIFDH